jgi:S1-C subfamily serine protease
MVPSNALRRTFRIAYGDGTGTCFTIDVDSRQYIVTARHVVSGATGTVTVGIQHQSQWKELKCELVGLADDPIDVAVLTATHQISPNHPLEPTTRDLYLSQDVYFLGFPYGLQADIGELNAHFPLPLVKKGCVSMLALGPATAKYILLDGHNNPGFSGGPVIFSPAGKPGEVRVAGIVSGYRSTREKIYIGENETPFTHEYNTGIVVAYAIEYAVDLIRKSPIGAELKASDA